MKNALLCLLLLPAMALAKPWWIKDDAVHEGDFLPPDQAFRVSTQVDGELLRVRWIIAEGYYLYRSKFDISAESPGLALDAPVLPDGHIKTDPYLGTQEIYQHEVEAVVGFKRSDAGAHPLQIKVTYQGCAEAGLCYPPISQVLNPGAAAPRNTPLDSPTATSVPPRPSAVPVPMLAIGVGCLGFFIAGWSRRRQFSATEL